MHVEACALSDTGRVREQNEDSYCIEAELGLYVVCDGMGGHAAGEVASSTAVATISRVVSEHRGLLRDVRAGREPLEAASGLLQFAVCEASRTIFELASSELGTHGMGTTCIALLVLGEKAIMAHVGDSRLYLARDGQLHQLSRDHTFLNDAIGRGAIAPEQAASLPHAHMLTRAVGVQPTVRVDLLTFDLLSSDTLLLCSDGLYEYAEDPLALARTLAEPDLGQGARALVDAALAGGGHDNATALLVRATSDEPSHRARKSSITAHLAALQSIELFRGFTMAELVCVYNVLTTLDVPPGEAVLREGEPGAHLFVIVEGRFEVSRAGLPLATLGPGTHFGEMALLNQRPRSATVTAQEWGRLLQLDRGSFHALIAREPSIAAKFLWTFAQTLSLRLDDTYLARNLQYGRATLPGGP